MCVPLVDSSHHLRSIGSRINELFRITRQISDALTQVRVESPGRTECDSNDCPPRPVRCAAALVDHLDR